MKHDEFRIGGTLYTGAGAWVCTDVGTRVVVAVREDRLKERPNGPPYELVESVFDAFFVCDVEPLVAAAQPKLWIHGHTHESVDYRVGRTRVVCNPHGYAGHAVNARFDPRFTVEV